VLKSVMTSNPGALGILTISFRRVPRCTARAAAQSKLPEEMRPCRKSEEVLRVSLGLSQMPLE
jgi:hypothetical protein